MRDVDEVGDPSHQVLLVLVQIAVGVRHPPEQLHDVRLLPVVEPVIDEPREFVERRGVVGPFLRARQQVPCLVRGEVVERGAERAQHRFALRGADFVVGPHHLDQQRRRRDVVAVLARLGLLGARRGGDGGLEQSPECPDHGVLRGRRPSMAGRNPNPAGNAGSRGRGGS